MQLTKTFPSNSAIFIEKKWVENRLWEKSAFLWEKNVSFLAGRSCRSPPGRLFFLRALLTEGVSLVSWTEVRGSQLSTGTGQGETKASPVPAVQRDSLFPGHGRAGTGQPSHAEPRSHRDVLAPAGENDNDSLLTERERAVHKIASHWTGGNHLMGKFDVKSSVSDGGSCQWKQTEQLKTIVSPIGLRLGWGPR